MPKSKPKNSNNVLPSYTGPSANWKNFLAKNPSLQIKKSIQKSNTTVQNMNIVKALKGFSDQKIDSYIPLEKIYGLDCEMVGVSYNQKDMLARVSIVDQHGKCVYDKFVKPTEPVTDYRTWVSGVRPHDLANGYPFHVVRREVLALLDNSIVVGHSVGHDFTVLKMHHPRHLIRDTAQFPLFRAMFHHRTPSLRNLARAVLGVDIQSGEHSSVQDARATVQLYMSYRKEWEEYIASRQHQGGRYWHA